MLEPIVAFLCQGKIFGCQRLQRQNMGSHVLYLSRQNLTYEHIEDADKFSWSCGQILYLSEILFQGAHLHAEGSSGGVHRQVSAVAAVRDELRAAHPAVAAARHHRPHVHVSRRARVSCGRQLFLSATCTTQKPNQASTFSLRTIEKFRIGSFANNRLLFGTYFQRIERRTIAN